MKWPRRTRRTADPSARHTEARKALHKSNAHLREAQVKNTEVTATVRTLKKYGRSNNFTEMIRTVLEGDTP